MDLLFLFGLAKQFGLNDTSITIRKNTSIVQFRIIRNPGKFRIIFWPGKWTHQ